MHHRTEFPDSTTPTAEPPGSLFGHLMAQTIKGPNQDLRVPASRASTVDNTDYDSVSRTYNVGAQGLKTALDEHKAFNDTLQNACGLMICHEESISALNRQIHGTRTDDVAIGKAFFVEELDHFVENGQEDLQSEADIDNDSTYREPQPGLKPYILHQPHDINVSTTPPTANRNQTDSNLVLSFTDTCIIDSQRDVSMPTIKEPSAATQSPPSFRGIVTTPELYDNSKFQRRLNISEIIASCRKYRGDPWALMNGEFQNSPDCKSTDHQLDSMVDFTKEEHDAAPTEAKVLQDMQEDEHKDKKAQTTAADQASSIPRLSHRPRPSKKNVYFAKLQKQNSELTAGLLELRLENTEMRHASKELDDRMLADSEHMRKQQKALHEMQAQLAASQKLVGKLRAQNGRLQTDKKILTCKLYNAEYKFGIERSKTQAEVDTMGQVKNVPHDDIDDWC